ncbi:MAG: hypothetical protein PUD44_12355 [Clostridiaceae bacterium]|nr:hypothetical protein [Clostridiaceae bacterium]
MGRLSIGWASRDVSTTAPINIPGQFHMRISKGILDPVTTTALVVDGGDDLAIFLSLDAVVIRAHLLDEVREEVRKRNPEIPAEKILMNATHAHTGPSHYNDDTEIPHDGMEIASSEAYRHWLSAQAADAVVEAYEKRAPGGVAYGYGYAVVAHSRRVVYFDDLSKRPGAVINSTHGVNGHAAMYGNTNDDQFSHYEAGADHFVNIMFTFDAGEHLTGAIVNIPCPSQNSEQEYMLSADYWHDIRTALRGTYGDIFVLPQCAAAGDLSPRILHYGYAQTRRYRLKYGEIETPAANKSERINRMEIAERVKACFDEVYSWAKKEIYTELPVRHSVRTVGLARRIITDEEYQYAVDGLRALEGERYIRAEEPAKTQKTDDPLVQEPELEGFDPQAALRSNSILKASRNRFAEIIDRYELQKTQPELPMELHVIQIGDIAFASNRFELYMDYQHRIQARSPFVQTFIVQLAGQPGVEGGSYLCTERGAWGRGYSASMYCNVVSPKGGQQLVEETVRTLKELYQGG